MRINVDQVPREPEAACLYVAEFVLENREKYVTGNEYLKTRRDDLRRNIQIIEVAAKRLTYGDQIVAQLNEMAASRESYTNGLPRYAGDIFRTLSNIVDIVRLARLDRHFTEAESVEGEAVFTLGRDEIEQVLFHTNEMRVLISVSDYLDKAHKQRLLKRIAQIEFELYREKSHFDAILGGVVDFGDALGKFGSRVKPLVDRMKEIRKITQSKTEAYDQLPAPEEVPRLPKPDAGDSE